MSSRPETPRPMTAIQHFDATADGYEASTGGCTREVAQFFLELPQMASVYATESVILDNACGSGVVTDELILRWRSKRTEPNALPPIIDAVDAAPRMVELARSKVPALANGHPERIRHAVMPAERLDHPDEGFTHSITNMGLPFFTDKAAGAREIHRTLRKGGLAVVSAWRVMGYIEPILHPAQQAARSADPLFKAPIPLEWQDPEHIKKCLVQDGGFEQVELLEYEAKYGAATAEELAKLLIGVFKPIMAQGWSEQEQELFKQTVQEKTKEAAVPYTMVDGKPGVGVPMVAIVAICQK